MRFLSFLLIKVIVFYSLSVNASLNVENKRLLDLAQQERAYLITKLGRVSDKIQIMNLYKKLNSYRYSAQFTADVSMMSVMDDEALMKYYFVFVEKYKSCEEQRGMSCTDIALLGTAIGNEMIVRHLGDSKTANFFIRQDPFAPLSEISGPVALAR